MFKKIKPKILDIKFSVVPHCDQRVLHAPGECAYCDKHPDWQALRQLWCIAFTGYEPEGNEVKCPSEQARNIETINKWPGNRPDGK